MSTPLHPDEVRVDAALAARLLAPQFPLWAHLPITPVVSGGTENAMFRLGEELALRFPLRSGAALQTRKEHLWLPKLAPLLPLQIPVPLAEGQPALGYPWAWSVCEWLEGSNATLETVSDAHQLALDLAAFIRALHDVTVIGRLLPEDQHSGRGVPLAERDEEVRQSIAELEGRIDTAAALAAWEADMHALAWAGEPVWLHGDLTSGNLLARDGRLAAVIDFGCLAMGDPACDLIPAWNLLPAAARQTFRQAMNVDEATWRRGRGWALSIALIYIPYYQETKPKECAQAQQVIETILADHTVS